MIYSQYDEIADKYDSFFGDSESLQENNEIGQMLSFITGSVCDIGCGTGLYVELKCTQPTEYFGIDPSKSMLDKFIEKHPSYRYRLENSTFEDSHISLNTFDNVISLFGSISYVNPKYLPLINEHSNHHFLMFYKPDYTPITYKRADVIFLHYSKTIKELKNIFRSSSVKEYKNYIIVRK